MDYSKLSELEKEAIRLIESEDEIVQSELWKILDCSAGKGSEIARKLEELGMIERGKIVKNGSSTYKLVKAPKNVKDLNFSLLLSGDQISPFIDNNNIDVNDERFTQWIMKLSEEYDN